MADSRSRVEGAGVCFAPRLWPSARVTARNDRLQGIAHSGFHPPKTCSLPH
jgi:hypothetical protein